MQQSRKKRREAPFNKPLQSIGKEIYGHVINCTVAAKSLPCFCFDPCNQEDWSLNQLASSSWIPQEASDLQSTQCKAEAKAIPPAHVQRVSPYI